MEFSACAKRLFCSNSCGSARSLPLLCMALFVDEKFGPVSVVPACSLGTPILAEELTAIGHG